MSWIDGREIMLWCLTASTNEPLHGRVYPGGSLWRNCSPHVIVKCTQTPHPSQKRSGSYLRPQNHKLFLPLPSMGTGFCPLMKCSLHDWKMKSFSRCRGLEIRNQWVVCNVPRWLVENSKTTWTIHHSISHQIISHPFFFAAYGFYSIPFWTIDDCVASIMNWCVVYGHRGKHMPMIYCMWIRKMCMS